MPPKSKSKETLKNSKNKPWGNTVYNEEEAGKPKNENIRGEGDKMQMYNSRTKQWVRAYDPDGDYGGPYKAIKELAAQPKWQEDMLDIYGEKVFHEKFHRILPEHMKRAKSRSPSKKKSRSPSKTRRRPRA
jgi:hypothetical protein